MNEFHNAFDMHNANAFHMHNDFNVWFAHLTDGRTDIQTLEVETRPCLAKLHQFICLHF